MAYLPELLALTKTLDCPDVTSKKRVLETLSCVFSENHPTLDRETLFNSFLERERLGSTAIGHGVAIPHIRTTIDRPIAALLRLPQGVDFGGDDGERVYLVVGLIVPEDHIDQHLQILAEIAKDFRDTEFREQLRRSSDQQDLYQVAMNYHE